MNSAPEVPPQSAGAARRSRPPWARSLLGPVGLGLAVALLVILDPLVGPLLQAQVGRRDLLHSFPHALAFLTIMILAAVVLFAWCALRFRPARGDVGVALIILSSQVPALSMGRINPIDVVIVACLGMGLLALFINPSLRLCSSPLNALSAAFLLGVIASMFNSRPTSTLGGLVSYGSKAASMLLLVNLIRTPEQFRRALKFLILGACISALAAAAQVGCWVLTNKVVTLANPAHVWAPTPLGLWLRATAFFEEANILGNCLSVVAVVVLYLLFRPGAMRREQMQLLAIFLLLVLGLLLTVSRGGWLALCIAGGLLPFVKKPQYTLHGAAALTVLLLALFLTGALEGLWQAVHSLNKSGVDIRLSVFELGIDAFGRHPFTGVGVYNFANYSGNHYHLPVHNAPLQVLSEMGLAGGIPYLAMLAVLLLHGVLAWRRCPPGPTRFLIQACLFGFITLLCHMQTEPIANSSFTWLYFGIVEAMYRLWGRATPPEEAA